MKLETPKYRVEDQTAHAECVGPQETLYEGGVVTGTEQLNKGGGGKNQEMTKASMANGVLKMRCQK